MSADNKIRETVQAQESFLEWLLQTWREKNWLRLLLIFIIAVVIGLRAKRLPRPVAIDERRTIKGLRPFYFDDADIFDHLQRTEIIRECVSAITDKQFRFGVLSGQSGSGKTSFLQAGLWPALARNKNQCVYVKFTELDPLETLRTALIDGKLISREASETGDLVKLLDSCDLSGTGSLVLLFDQFEQFFLQNKRKNDRRPFIRGLADWYQSRSNQAIKILVCIRSDFSDRLIELQKTMGYSLGPQETFRLDRFDPQQAAAVLRVIAQTEGITIDEAFVEELANQQLASPDDGLISPVDIQILALMIAGENAAEDRAFNRAAYDALGGIEGLLEKFLKRALSARETPSRHRAALNVLLALTDFDNDSRAGTLTVEQLEQKLENTITLSEIEEATGWLARSDVRLITPNQQGGITVYELAHERLIPALRRLAAKELSEVDLARRLLERKVSEWVANGKKSRYLLQHRELRLIRRHRALIIRNPQKDAKAKFLARSLVRFRIRLSAVCITLLLAASAGVWWFSPSGQMWQAERDLKNLTDTINDSETLYRVAKNLLKAGRSEEVHRLVPRLTRFRQIEILAQLRRRYEDIGAEQKAQEIKKEEEEQRLAFKGSSQETIALGIVYLKLGDMGNASKLIDKAKDQFVPEDIWGAQYNPSTQAILLQRSPRSHLLIAEAYWELGDLKRSTEELYLMLDADPAIFDRDLIILVDAALFCEKLGSSHCDSKAWEKIVRLGEKLPLLNSVTLLSVAARAFSVLGQSKTAQDLLQKAQIKLSTPIFRDSKYSRYGLVFDSGFSGPRERLWTTDRREMEGMDQLESKRKIFGGLAEALIDIAVSSKEVAFLERAEDALQLGFELRNTAELYLKLASAYLALGQEGKALQALRTACLAANMEDKRDERARLADLINAFFEKLSENVRNSINSEKDVGSSVSDVWLLSLQAQLLWRNGRTQEVHGTLAKAEEIVTKTFDYNSRVMLANTCALMGETGKGARYLEQVAEHATRLPPEAKAEAMLTLSDSYARNKQWRRARQAADQTGNDVIKAVSLSNLLAVWNEYN